MDLKDIRAIIELMKKNSISEFELERQEFKIKLKRGSAGSGSSDDLNASITPSFVVAAQAPAQASAPPSALVAPVVAGGRHSHQEAKGTVCRIAADRNLDRRRRTVLGTTCLTGSPCMI